jgi:hypothetical protein
LEEDDRLPGFIRVQEPDKRPYYRSPIPRKVLNDSRKVERYLEAQHSMGQLLEVKTEMFTFSRKKQQDVRSRKKQQDVSSKEPESLARRGAHPEQDKCKKQGISDLDFIVQQMTPNPDITIDHRAELSKTASNLDRDLVADHTIETQLDKELSLASFWSLKKQFITATAVRRR